MMKLSVFAAALFSIQALGATLASSGEKVSPALVDQVISLAHKIDEGSSELKVNAIVVDSGMSTDVSPRYSVYLGFASMAEMGNITATFAVVPGASKFRSAVRLRPGVYRIMTEEYGDNGMEEVIRDVDTTQVFIDERAARRQCGDEFCDLDLSSTVKIAETRTPKN